MSWYGSYKLAAKLAAVQYVSVGDYANIGHSSMPMGGSMYGWRDNGMFVAMPISPGKSMGMMHEQYIMPKLLTADETKQYEMARRQSALPFFQRDNPGGTIEQVTPEYLDESNLRLGDWMRSNGIETIRGHYDKAKNVASAMAGGYSQLPAEFISHMYKTYGSGITIFATIA